MKSFIILLCCLLFTKSHYAQLQFIAKGKIEFEKKVLLHKQLNDETDTQWSDMLKKSVPPVKTTYFDLYFDEAKTLYKPGREIVVGQRVPDWIDGPATDNIVYTNRTERNVQSQKTVFESTFNIQDSLTNRPWKITNETRTIAGFECRRATTIIMDSVFVVAFYTDQITTNGGPESFNGLPGMILGIAIPRLHTTWYATKLQLDINAATIIAPKKGKKTNTKSLMLQLEASMKNWGRSRDKNIWQILI